MQNFEGTMKSIMVFLKRAISLIYKKENENNAFLI